jgi:hypothetical protein
MIGMIGLRWTLAFVTAGGGALGCGAKTSEPSPIDASSETAIADTSVGDSAKPDSAIACVDGSGNMPTSLKTCTSNADCAMRTRRSDCCGSELLVGVRADVADAFASCEAERQKELPVCDCLAQPTRAEDGREISGFTAKVRCADFTGSGGICKTYVE